jgi:hypothetical protein
MYKSYLKEKPVFAKKKLSFSFFASEKENDHKK